MEFYNENYKTGCFITWYNGGKPSISKLYAMLEPTEEGNIPSKVQLNNWLKGWREQAEFLDQQVKKELEAKLIAEKAEMLSRHAKVGRKMQGLALEYLSKDDVVDKLSPNSAIRMVVEGWKIERSSVGMPDVLEDVMTKTDDELLEDISKLITEGSSEILIDEQDS